MYKPFSLKIDNKITLKGCKWEIENSQQNLVIVTGMAESSYRYDEFATFLNGNGFSVYCIDHYGQGHNCDTENQLGVWPKDGFAKAVEMVHQEVLYVKSISNNPVYLLGHSMGSFVTQEFIQLYGKEIDKVVICGTNGKMGATIPGGLIANMRCVFHSRDSYRDKLLNKLSFGAYNKKIKNPKTDFDWLSTNDESNKKYIDDFRCGFICTSGFYKEFMKGLNRIHKNSHVKRVPHDLPIMLIAGHEDPVGNYGKGVEKKYHQYKKAGIYDVDMHLYEGMRHEILNEIGREKVYEDVLQFFKN